MRLYFSPGACSLASRIVLEEVGTAYEAEQVDIRAKTCAAGDYTTVNPRGQVPALRMENGEILTEGAVIMQYIADLRGDGKILPKFGTAERTRVLEAVNFIATDIHKTYGALFAAERLVTDVAARESYKGNVRAQLVRSFDHFERQLAGREFVAGKEFTIADAYLFTCWNWNQHVGIDASAWKNLNTWATRVYARPAVQKAMKAEGLLK